MKIFDLLFTQNGFRWSVIIPLAIVVLIVIVGVFFADFIYGDWRCAFAECRIIK